MKSKSAFTPNSLQNVYILVHLSFGLVWLNEPKRGKKLTDGTFTENCTRKTFLLIVQMEKGKQTLTKCTKK